MAEAMKELANLIDLPFELRELPGFSLTGDHLDIDDVWAHSLIVYLRELIDLQLTTDKTDTWIVDAIGPNGNERAHGNCLTRVLLRIGTKCGIEWPEDKINV